MKYVLKSDQRVKPFVRTRKGKLEQVKEFTRRGREGYPKATYEAAIHQVGKDYGISKEKAREYLQRIEGLKQRVEVLKENKLVSNFERDENTRKWRETGWPGGKEVGEPYSTGKTFNYNKMKNLIDSDAFLKKMFNNTPGNDEKIAEVLFNTFVVGDSVMEREYNKFEEKGLKVDKQDHLHLVGEPFRVGEKVKVWKGEHEGKAGEVVSTDGMDVKIKHADGTIEVPKRHVVSTMEKAVQVKGFTRTRRGHLERVKPYSKEMQYVIKPKGEPFKSKYASDVFGAGVYPMPRRSVNFDEGYKAGRADKLLGISLTIARTSPIKDYAEGYSRGQLETHSVAFKLGEPISVKEQKYIIKQKLNEPGSPTSISGREIAEFSIKDIVGDPSYKDRFPIKADSVLEDDPVLGEIAGLVAEHYFPENAKEKEEKLLDFSEKWWKNWRAGNTEEDFDEFTIENFSDDLREKVSKDGGLEEPDFWKFAKEKIGEPLSTYGLASAEEPDEEGPELTNVTVERAEADKEILEAGEAKTTINKLVDMSNTIIDDNAVKQMKDALSKLEIRNDWEFKDYKDLVEFSEGELRDAKEHGYRSVNEYWQAEMPETVTATTSRKVRKSMKLMSIDEVLNLKKGKYDFGEEVPILSRPATELEKSKGPWKRGKKGFSFGSGAGYAAGPPEGDPFPHKNSLGWRKWIARNSGWIRENPKWNPPAGTGLSRSGLPLKKSDFEKATQQVKPFVRTRKGKMERVKGFSREAPTYSQYEGAVNYARNIKAMPMEEAVKWARMAVEFEQAIKAEKETARKAELIYGKQDAKMMREMHLGDAKDLQTVYTMWKREDYEGASWKAMAMDTAARDNIPLSVWNDIDKYRKENLGEPFSTKNQMELQHIAEAYAKKIGKKVDGAVEQDGTFSMGDDVNGYNAYKITEKGIELAEYGEPFKFKAEQKKIADKWESDLGDRLGAVKTKIQNKQPVSKEELDSLIQEAENWREFKVGEPYSTLGAEGYIEAKKAPEGHYQLFFRGTRNEIFPGEKFKSPSEAKQYWRAMKAKEKIGTQVGEPYKAPKTTPQRKKLDSDLHSMGLIAGEWDAITQKDNHDGTLTIGVKAIKKYKTPSHIEADVFSEEIHQPVGDMIKVRVKQSTGEIVEVVKEPIGEPFKTLENTTKEERMQVANTILLQMGGAGKIKAMTGAKNFTALPSGVSFQFPNRKGPNYVKVTLEADDTYTVEFGKKAGVQALMSGKVDVDNIYKKLSEHKDIYFDQLKDLFESETGLYLSLGKSVTSGEQFVVSLEKARGGFRMAHNEKGESEKVEEKKEQKEAGEEPSQKQQRMSRLAKERKEELAGPKNADADDAGMSFQEAPDTMGEGEV